MEKKTMIFGRNAGETDKLKFKKCGVVEIQNNMRDTWATLPLLVGPQREL